MEDKAIIELYWNRNEKAIEETAHKYGKLCKRIAENMLCDKRDSDECVNDTYLAAWNSIPPTRPSRFAAFLCKITKNLALKKIEHSSAKKRNCSMTVSIEELGECVSSGSSIENEIQLKELSKAISDFLYTQKERERIIFVKRYWFYESLADIASETNTSEKNVSLILFRTRNKLKSYLLKEGFDL